MAPTGLPTPPDTPLHGKGQDTYFDLTLLPNELLEKVFAHSDLRSFKSIRQVCNRFCHLADTKGSLDNFNIAVRPGRVRLLGELLALTERQFPWSHLLLDHFDNVELAQEDSPLVKNLEKLALLLKTRYALPSGLGLKSVNCPLRMDSSSGSSNFFTLQPFLLHCADTLESFGIIRMTEIRGKLLAALETAGVVQFPRLEYLSVAFDILDLEYSGNGLLSLMEMCPNLKRLDFMFADQEEHPMTKSSFESAVLHPILSYLNKLRETASTNSRSFTVNFESEGHKASIPFNFESLQKLLYHSKSRADGQTGIRLRLENVPFLALPKKRNLVAAQTMDPDILDRLNYTVKSIVGTSQDLKLSTMEIERDSFHSSCRHFMPPAAKFSLVVYLPSGNKIYLTCPSQLLPKDVQSITIVSENTRASLLLSISDEDSQWGEDKNKSFIEDLLVYRPGLHELRILNENDKHLDFPFLTQDSVNFKHFDSFRNFPNLKVLHLDYWGRTNPDFWELYESLPLLEELVLKKCYRLTDESVIGIGNGKNSMLQLKNLKHLVLDGYWSISDASFIQVFSKLGLQTLNVWDEPGLNGKPITMKALHCLPISKCGETLKVLRINKPIKSSLADVKKCLIKCRSLKRVELVEEAEAGSNMANGSILF